MGRWLSNRVWSRKQIAGVILLFILIIAGASFAGYVTQQPRPLLSTDITSRVSDFTPYFYNDEIPAGYAIDEARITANSDLLIIPLAKDSDTTIVVTEQPMPPNLTEEQLLQNGNKVEGASNPAVFSKVEGRVVGTMVAQNHKTLILLNAPDNVSEDDVIALLKNLRPL